MAVFCLVLTACVSKTNTPEGWDLLTDERQQQCYTKYNYEAEWLGNWTNYNNCRKTYRPIPSKAEIDWLTKRAAGRLIYVKGGEFLEGDFNEEKSVLRDGMKLGSIYEPVSPFQQSFLNSNQLKYAVLTDVKLKIGDGTTGASRLVRLSDFEFGSHLVEEQEYNIFAGAKAYPIAQDYQSMEQMNSRKEVPALATWNNAQAYCQWLGEQMNKPMSLPTEAQWEYAARSRGQYHLYGTDTGLYEEGKNVIKMYGESDFGLYSQKGYLPKMMEKLKSFSPNELGIYHLHVSPEFVYDWYSLSILAEEVGGENSDEAIKAEANRQVVVVDPRGRKGPITKTVAKVKYMKRLIKTLRKK